MNDYLMHASSGDEYVGFRNTLQQILNYYGKRGYNKINMNNINQYMDPEEIEEMVGWVQFTHAISNAEQYLWHAYERNFGTPNFQIGGYKKGNHTKSRMVKHSSTNDFREFSKEYNDYLMHHGILGMKWGIRRYQNPDGTLTSAGKKRYAKDRVNDIKKVVSSTEAYSKQRAEGINKIIEKHSKNFNPSESELQKKKEYDDIVNPLKQSYNDKHEYNKAVDLLASTMKEMYYPNDKESSYRYKNSIIGDDLDQGGEVTMAYLVNQGKSKKEIINIMNKAYKARDEYYEEIQNRANKILKDLGDIGEEQVGTTNWQKAKHEVKEALEEKSGFSLYDPYIAYLTDNSYSMGVLNKMMEIKDTDKVITMPEVSCHVYPVDYKVGSFTEDWNKIAKYYS